jgi:hypothetical protein
MPTRCGIDAAGDLFDEIPERERPADQEGLDRLLRTLAQKAVVTRAAIHTNPPITAVR